MRIARRLPLKHLSLSYGIGEVAVNIWFLKSEQYSITLLPEEGNKLFLITMPGFATVDSLSSSRKYSHTVGHSVPPYHSGGIYREPISNKRKRIVFVILACANIVTNMCLALIAPIFPQVVSYKLYSWECVSSRPCFPTNA